jgi:hypothetical protein
MLASNRNENAVAFFMLILRIRTFLLSFIKN